MIKDLYDKTTTCMKTCVDMLRVHQQQESNPNLVVLVMDELSIDIQNKVSQCMLFANDMVLIDRLWQQLMLSQIYGEVHCKSKDFVVSQSKTEYMQCKFNNVRQIIACIIIF